MDIFFNNLRFLDRKGFFYLYNFTSAHPVWRQIFGFFAEYGIVIIILGIIYLIAKNRINAFFAIGLSVIISTILSSLIYLFWQRPRPYITYADVSKFTAHTTAASFPSAHTFLSFAIATVTILYGHKKLGGLMIILAIIIGISRVATGVHYPSDVIGGAAIGIFSGILSSWFMESFEHFWESNSAK